LKEVVVVVRVSRFVLPPSFHRSLPPPSPFHAHLRVLVDEHERVGHVAVAQVHHAEADPGAALALHGREDGAHLGPDARAGLHAVKALARVEQLVAALRAQQVRVRLVPQAEHAPHDLAPQPQALVHVEELRAVVVRELGARVRRPEVRRAVPAPVVVRRRRRRRRRRRALVAVAAAAPAPDGQREARLDLLCRDGVGVCDEGRRRGYE
jgi:hypothetical protein